MTALKPIGRTLAEFQPLQPAEKKLLVACRAGEVAKISEQRPTEVTTENTVRAAFLRFLLLGGDEHAPVHEKGVQLRGAWVADKLNMAGAQMLADVFLVHCHFFGVPNFMGASVQGSLDLSHSKLTGFAGVMLSCDGKLHLNGLQASGQVSLSGAQVGGQVSCQGAFFDCNQDTALSMSGAVIKGSVFLDKKLIVKGKVILLRAQIAGNLSCEDSLFDGANGTALSMDGVSVTGAWFFRNLKLVTGRISLSSAHVGRLIDDEKSWCSSLALDGFVYDSIAGGAPTDAATRISWLDKQEKMHLGLGKNNHQFRPQPWRQLIKVLREMGHEEDARLVAIAFEQRRRAAHLIAYPKLHWLFGKLTGYGYRPMRLLWTMLGVWLFCAALYWCAALHGVFAPSDPLVFQNQKYEVCAPSYVAPASAVVAPVNGAGNWYLCAALPEEYSGFSPLAYSLDVILPLVDLQQESSWSPLIPTPNKTWYTELFTFEGGKHWTRLLVWFEILFGWLASLLLVAVVSGLTKRREE
jgi:hypothetical protein